MLLVPLLPSHTIIQFCFGFLNVENKYVIIMLGKIFSVFLFCFIVSMIKYNDITKSNTKVS